MRIVPAAPRDGVEYRSNVAFYDSARAGFRGLLRSVEASKKVVLLPSYIGYSPREGSGIFDPVRASGLPYRFYPLRPDLTIDVEVLEDRLQDGDVGVVLAVHYFGKPDPRIALVAEIAERFGAKLIEDLAHAYFSYVRGADLGRYGSASLFSLHKQFPMADGGMAMASATTTLRLDPSTRSDLAQAVAAYDTFSIGEVRRTRFEQLTERLKASSRYGGEFTLLWPQLEQHAVPQSLPVLIEHANRDRLYEHMNADGVGMVSLYHTLISEARGVCEVAERTAGRIINLPVHQGVAHEDIDRIVAVFERDLEQR